MTREQKLEKALHECAASLPPSSVSRAAAFELLGLDLYGNPINNQPARCECGAMIMTGGTCGPCRRSD